MPKSTPLLIFLWKNGHTGKAMTQFTDLLGNQFFVVWTIRNYLSFVLGLNVAMHKPLLLPQHRNAWLTNDGIISTRAKDCYSHYLQPEESLTWKLDLTEVFQVHSIRVLTLGT